MLKQLRTTIINNLLVSFNNETSQLKLIQDNLKKLGLNQLIFDHFALIDLPGAHSGISHLCQIFSALGYLVQGRDYLPTKQNEFLWMTEFDSKKTPAHEVLPQVVVADFRLDEMPLNIKKIIEKYTRQAPPSPLIPIQKLIGRVYLNDFHAAQQLNQLVSHYLKGRDWPPPTKRDFCEVEEFNKLLAWVLIFGRKPNHFTLAIHLQKRFKSLLDFLNFVEEDLNLPLNHEGGALKGSAEVGIEQGSTQGTPLLVKLPGGEVEILSEFVEFIWRFPIASCPHPHFWEDYHVDFIPQHANRVIESLTPVSEVIDSIKH